MTTTLENLREASSALSEQERVTLRDAILRASRHSVSWERKQFERKTLIRKQRLYVSSIDLDQRRALSTRLSELDAQLAHLTAPLLDSTSGAVSSSDHTAIIEHKPGCVSLECFSSTTKLLWRQAVWAISLLNRRRSPSCSAKWNGCSRWVSL
mmetsp:Transcript_26908/g.67647  ORF Transcript_26908/g.67647 Transcript_26908/m.67647 type:complete len:153 (+) Transcript_26908:371-829(+)